MKLRILHKGLILLLFPLVLQAVLLGQLYLSFSETERLSAMEEKVSRLVDDVDEMISDILKVLWQMNMRLGGRSRGEPFDTEAMNMKESMILNRLADVAHNDPDLESYVAQSRALWQDMYRVLKRFATTQTDAESAFARLSDISEYWPNAVSIMHNVIVVEYFRHKQMEVLRHMRHSIAEHRAAIETFISVMAMAEIALTFGLLFYFLKDVTKRLSILVHNAGLIPKGEPMTRQVEGGDESAYLDQVLHKASNSLHQSAEHRKSIMEMLSHDLRAPLNSANISLDLLLNKETFNSKDKHDEKVVAIKRNLTKLVQFVEDMLTIDKLESGKLQLNLSAVELRSLVEEAFDSLGPQAKGRELALANNVEKIEVVADKNRLYQVLMNLLTNAIKFSPDGAAISVSSEKKESEVIVSVKDEGPGITKEEQSKLFEKFHQVNSADSKGFGLGLSISKLIVTKHGGSLGVASEPGQGSTFWFSLPLEPEDDI